jgi:hypothetical protein
VNDKVLVKSREERLLAEGRSLDDALSRRVNADPERVEKGLAQLVLTIVELLRQLMERQALHRIEGARSRMRRWSAWARHSWRWRNAWIS